MKVAVIQVHRKAKKFDLKMAEFWFRANAQEVRFL
jgi:hypothetical protein